jgi:hypothetical protein
MGTWRTTPAIAELFGSGDFDDLAAWFDSPEGQLTIKSQNIVDRTLKKADVDAHDRKIIWKDGQRLSITQTATRIHERHPKIPFDFIDQAVVHWLTSEFVPEGYTEEHIPEFEEFEQLTMGWADDHERRQGRLNPLPRTRDS